ncbi:MAG: CoA transferase [Alphaproteobacteria bacterium]|nr:CoA transferase [Alphaproteobacteria bacterium]MCB9928228.1 CoA transferase [Alphaproteobacteria bacterium]
MERGILSNITVIDMTEGVAGPYAAMVLSDQGANVVKVERPAGDWSRPADHFQVDGEANAQFIALNRNKRDIGLDVASPGGRAVLERLVGRADVLISNYRPGVMAKLGFGYERCRVLKPDLVYCTISGFGQTGPYAELPASDTIMQAMSGVMSLVGEPDGPPLRVGFPLIDMAAANAAVQAILLALYGRLTGKGGAEIDISLMAAALALMSAGYTRFRASGKVPLRQGNQNTNLAPAGAFRAGDGRHISLAILRNEHWQKLCAALGLEDLAGDPRYATNALRVEHRAELDAIIEPLFAAEPAAYWVERLRAADILCGPINTFADVAGDPNLAAALPLVDPMAPSVPEAIGVPIRRDGRYNATYRPAPAKGQHTREILAEFGFADDETETLLAEGAAFEAPQ